jgi:hypothetical protein
MILTIDINCHNDIVARDDNGNVKALASRYCNPAALAQVVCEAEMIGTIDWENSQVAKPE